MEKSVHNIILSYRKEIIEIWLESFYASYPDSSIDFLKSENDSFSNPVGATIRQSFVNIYKCAVEGQLVESIRDSMDNLIRIRAVQGYSPSEAVSFLFMLRKTVYEYLVRKDMCAVSIVEMSELDAWIDSAIALGFDIYMECRESIFNLKVNEIKKSALRVE
jgi:hypothetical protein